MFETVATSCRLVAAVRDVQWPERTFGVPRTVKGDEIEIEVRVGPRQNTSLYNAAGISETLLGAKNEACKKLFKILYDDPSFNRIWDQRMCTVRPVLKVRMVCVDRSEDSDEVVYSHLHTLMAADFFRKVLPAQARTAVQRHFGM